MRRFMMAMALSLAAAGGTVYAQDRPEVPGRLFVGGSALYGEPVGSFGALVPQGFGVAGHAIYAVDRRGWLGLRLDGGFMDYGRESQDVCFGGAVGCRVGLDLTTSNSIAFLGVGPQLLAPTGGLRPYVTGSVGLAYFATRSTLRGRHDFDNFASTTHFDDLTFAWTGAAGIYVPVRRGPQPISIDVGARFHGNGEAEYLREGDIVDHPDGSISLFPNRTEANLWTFQLGVSVGTQSRRR